LSLEVGGGGRVRLLDLVPVRGVLSLADLEYNLNLGFADEFLQTAGLLQGVGDVFVEVFEKGGGELAVLELLPLGLVANLVEVAAVHEHGLLLLDHLRHLPLRFEDLLGLELLSLDSFGGLLGRAS